MNLIRSRSWVLLLLGLLGGFGFTAHAQNPEPAGWYTGDMHVHRSCGGSPVSLTTIRNAMSTHDLAIVALLADMGNGEVQNPTTDLPKVNGQDDPISTAGRIVHWDAEWHWDATYGQYAHQALGGHLVALGLNSAQQIWSELTSTIFDWAHQQGGIAGFAHMQYLDDIVNQGLSCCTPIEYPVEVALGACDFVSEDVSGSDTAMQAYYRLLNCGFRPGFAGGSDYPCNAQIGALLTYVQVTGALTYDKWVDGIANRRTVVSRNGHNEFLDLKVNGTATPGDEIALSGSGSLPVTIKWTAKENLTGTIELVHNGVVVASQSASVASGSSSTLSTPVNFPKSGWLAARRMGGGEHQVQTGAVFVKVNNAPVRASVADAQFYVAWMDNLIQKTSPTGPWNGYFPNNLAAAQARYQSARSIYQQIALEAAGPQPLAISTTSLPNGITNASYSATLTATGGAQPYSWSLASGSLPPSLTLNASSGTISGTPTTTGTYNFTARVTDASNPTQTATKALSIATGGFTGTPGTFGNTADGTSSDTIWDNGAWINAGRFQATSNTAVSTMQAKVAAVSGKYKCAIYTDSGAQPSQLLRSTAEVSNPGTGWQVFPLTSSVVLTNGSYYWLAIWSDNANARVYYSSTTGTLRWSQNNYGAWPNPISTSGGGSLNYCIYATGTGVTLTNITVTPLNPIILGGASQQFTATGTYSDGSTQNVTSQATWTSSSPAVATVNVGGLASGISAGTTTISAALGGKTGGATLTVQAGPLSITTATLPNAVVNSAYSATLAASGGTAPYSWSLASGNLPPGLTLNSTSGAITGTPTSAGTSNFTAQVSDVSNPVKTATRSLTLTVSSLPAVATIWPGTAVPGVVDVGATAARELGVKFRSDEAGNITGIRFYKAAANTGTHVGNLWTSGGTRLAQVTFTGETASGWQQMNFAAPVAITSNTVYVASYRATTGHYSGNAGYFSTVGVDNFPLHALAQGVSGANGVYRNTSTSAFPNVSGNGTNFWVDVAFVSSATPDTTPPLVTAVSPVAGATGVGVTTTVTATFNEAMNASTLSSSTFLLRDNFNALVPAAVTYNTSTRVATLTPQATLAALATHTATVVAGTAGAKDAAGNPLASNFVWSFTTLPPDATAPTVSSVNPVAGATGISRSTSVTVAFNEAMNVSTINTSTFVLLDPNGIPVPATVSNNAPTFTAVLTPNGLLSALGTHTAAVEGGPTGVKDLAGNALASDFVWIFTTSNQAAISIWDNSVVPAVLADSDTSAVELGLRFRSAVAGSVKGIRFYKSTANTGTHIGNVWNSAGTRLATVTFAGETASGWQYQALASPLAISANTTYIVSYFAPVARYSVNVGYFSGAGVDRYPLRALADGEDGANGLYRYGTTSAFPNQTWSSGNYWVDVVFE